MTAILLGEDKKTQGVITLCFFVYIPRQTKDVVRTPLMIKYLKIDL